MLLLLFSSMSSCQKSRTIVLSHPIDDEDGHGVIIKISFASSVRLSHTLQISFEHGAELRIRTPSYVLHGVGVAGRTRLLRARSATRSICVFMRKERKDCSN